VAEFTRYKSTSLYPASNLSPDMPGWIFAATETGGDADLGNLPAGPLLLSQALTWTAPDWAGSLIYIARNASQATGDADSFAAAISTILSSSFGDQGALIFLPSPAIESLSQAQLVAEIGKSIWIVPLRRHAGQINPKSFFDTTLTGVQGVSARFNPNATLSVPETADDGYILFTPTGNAPVGTLAGPSRPSQGNPDDLTVLLHFDGPTLGAFTFEVEIARPSLKNDLNMGFQVVIPNPIADNRP